MGISIVSFHCLHRPFPALFFPTPAYLCLRPGNNLRNLCVSHCENVLWGNSRHPWAESVTEADIEPMSWAHFPWSQQFQLLQIYQTCWLTYSPTLTNWPTLGKEVVQGLSDHSIVIYCPRTVYLKLYQLSFMCGRVSKSPTMDINCPRHSLPKTFILSCCCTQLEKPLLTTARLSVEALVAL